MIKSRFKAFAADRKGGVIIYVALALPVLVGGMGLGAETGYRYHNQRLLQHAADVSAHTGAVRLYKGDAKAQIDTAATFVAVSSEFDNGVGSIAVNIPPTTGAFTADPSAVEVILTETRPRLFSAIFSNEPVVIAARAVAAANGSAEPACILALSPTASAAVTVTGSTNINLMGCAVASNSTAANSFNMQGNGANITADCVQTSGGSVTRAGLTLTECDQIRNNQPPVDDPYFFVIEPDTSVIPCQTAYNGNNPQVGQNNRTTSVPESPSHARTWTHPDGTALSVMRFCSGLRVRGTVNFAPGVYIIENGDLFLNSNAIITGTDVTFYFRNGGRANINGSVQVNLAAPDTGPYAGILFFGSRSNPVAHDISGNSSSTLTGAVYMPASQVTFTGNSTSANGCTQVIANTIVLTGSSGLASECVNTGTEQILLGDLIAVVE